MLIGFGLVLVALATAMVVVATTQRNYALDQLDRQLESALPFAVGPPEGVIIDRPTVPPDNSSFEARTSDFFVGTVTDGGELTPVIRGNLLDDVPSVSPDDLAALGSSGGTFTTEGQDTTTRFRVRAAPGPTSGSWAVVALSLADADAANRALLVALGTASLMIVIVLLITGWWMYRLGLRPISEITSAAESIAAGDRDHRVDPDMPGTEAAKLARAFNVMLDERDAQEQTLRRFVADASHELRTPLTSVRGYLEVYADGGFRGRGEIDDVVRRLLGETKRMNDLVEDLLLLANLDEGRPLARKPVDLGDVLADAADDGRAIEPERSITTAIEGADLEVIGDEARLRQVVASLVHNALVHTPPTASIRLEGERRDDDVWISVIDTGPGMPPEVAQHAFDRFYRGDPSRSRHAGGAGLGLPIARSVIEAHDGTITIESRSPRGTAFRIRLPVHRDEGPSADHRPKEL
ncbi:MAG: HAMP domain-containing sensor histidine kinase [Acidimicrobiales bacterium]